MLWGLTPKSPQQDDPSSVFVTKASFGNFCVPEISAFAESRVRSTDLRPLLAGVTAGRQFFSHCENYRISRFSVRVASPHSVVRFASQRDDNPAENRRTKFLFYHNKAKFNKLFEFWCPRWGKLLPICHSLKAPWQTAITSASLYTLR